MHTKFGLFTLIGLAASALGAPLVQAYEMPQFPKTRWICKQSGLSPRESGYEATVRVTPFAPNGEPAAAPLRTFVSLGLLPNQGYYIGDTVTLMNADEEIIERNGSETQVFSGQQASNTALTDENWPSGEAPAKLDLELKLTIRVLPGDANYERGEGSLTASWKEQDWRNTPSRQGGEWVTRTVALKGMSCTLYKGN
jgi:hypothetical protein